MNKGDTNKLIKDLNDGSDSAFRTLFDLFYPSLCLFSEKYVVNTSAAQDIAQEAFVKYWEKHHTFDNILKIKSYLYVSVRNASLNYLRLKKHTLALDDLKKIESEDFYKDILIEEETYRIFYQAINSLPNQMKTVIQFTLEGLKNKEIAEQMGISENTVHSHKKEAYKKLKENLKVHYLLDLLLIMINHTL
ncbi:RNA polymerase sigma-70 factor [Plebeiibacterium marinum]|uniref:RNA polymerase sigma-70 factor n=1 Tax=Plebeiibacterium marinum TaxID=2992111 RepID=A0AAE3SKL4_9BACT|nr:RNA polymerase sigma-70 factor [Plebeiobacterium marinum]MCW3806633.1 RNA polymerase sigma-70 factor [Plebeiobacterium marinum]